MEITTKLCYNNKAVKITKEGVFMKVIAKKTKKIALVVIDLIIGIIMTLLGFVILPVIMFTSDAQLYKEPLMWIIVVVGMLFFGLVGYFANIRQLILYKKSKDVQAETDGEYLYLYGNKEAKIPLADMKEAELDAVIPYMLSHEFIIHLVSDKYGKVVIKVPNYGKYRLYFISDANETVQYIYSLIQSK